MLDNRFAVAVLAPLVLLISTAVASADTVSAYWPDGLGYHLNISYDDDGAGPHAATVDNIPVGMYFWYPTAGSNNVAPFNTMFVSFCIDADQYAESPTTFTLKPLEQAPNSNGPGAAGSGSSSTFMSTAQADLLRELWGEQFPSLCVGTATQQNDKTAAFQLAIWEILFENSSTKDASSGYLKVLYSGAKPTYVNLANQYLASTYDAGASAYETKLVALTSSSGQDHIVMVPLPRALMAGLVLVGAIGAMRLRGGRADAVGIA